MDKCKYEKLHPPEIGTVACRKYFDASERSSSLLNLVVDTILVGDFSAFVLKKALDDEDWKDIKDPRDLARQKPGSRTIILRRYSQELLEMFLSRGVDNFQTYLVDIIRDILKKNPSILKTRQQTITLGYVLNFLSMEDLVSSVIESKINSLSYQGFNELQEWCTSRGIPLLIPIGQENSVIELIATRNIITHTRGIVDNKYFRTIKDTTFKLGDKRIVDVDCYINSIQLLNGIVKDTDTAIIEKFNIETAPLKPEIKGSDVTVAIQDTSGDTG